METLISSIWTPNINIWQIHVSKKKQNQKKTNTFNKSQKKSRHQQQQLTLESNSFDFSIPSVGRKKNVTSKPSLATRKTPPPLNCWNGFGAEPPSLACQHLEASRWGNRYLRCSVWNLYVLDEGVCVFCRKVISCWWLEEIRLDTELRLVLNNLFTRSFAHTKQVVLWDFWTNNDVSFTKMVTFRLVFRWTIPRWAKSCIDVGRFANEIIHFSPMNSSIQY